MSGQLSVDERLEQTAVLRLDRTALDEQLTQRSVLGRQPGLHRREYVVRFGQLILQGQHREEQIAFGSAHGHVLSRLLGLFHGGLQVADQFLEILSATQRLQPWVGCAACRGCRNPRR